MNNRPSGSIPRKTTINDQPHMLAYINPQEAMMLKSMGGTGKPGPGGIPAFAYGIGGQGAAADNFGYSPEAPGEGGAEKAAREAINSQTAKDQLAAGMAPQLEAMQETINSPVEQTGILGTLSKFSPMHMAGRALNKAQMQSAYDQLAGTSTPNKGLFAGIGKSLGITPEITGYEPVFDGAGNIVGSAGIGTGGNVVGYRGQRTGDLFGPPDVQGYVNAMNEAGQGGPDSPGGSEGPPPIIIDDDTEESGETTSTYNPEDYVVKNLDIIQPGTTVAGEVPTIYNQGGVVSLDPFNQLRNRM